MTLNTPPPGPRGPHEGGLAKPQWPRTPAAALALLACSPPAAVAGIALMGVFVLGSPSHAYLSSVTVAKCLAGKLKTEGKGAAACIDCYRKNALAPEGAALTACSAKASGKVTGGFGKLDTKYGGLCPGGTADGPARGMDAASYASSVNTIVGSALDKCDARKQKCIGKYLAAIMGCYAKAANKTGTIDTRCTGKAAAKLSDGAKGCLDKAAADDCTNAGTQGTALRSTADAYLNGQTCLLDPGNAGCACPTSFTFTANGPTTDYDTGWYGFGHDRPLTSGVQLTLAVRGCAGSVPPCGQCTTSGPVVNAGGAASANRRCRGDTGGNNGSWIQCGSDADCPGIGNACTYFFGPPQPMARGGVSVCVVNEIPGPISGTVNIETGSSVTPLTWSKRIYAPPTLADPCPRCISNVCSGGQRDGQGCTVNGTSAPFADDVSFDCPPLAAGFVSAVTETLPLATGTQTATLSAASPNCRGTGFTGHKCFCDTCNNTAATPCTSNADCTAVGATICGGKRCLGGTNDGTPCTTDSECPGVVFTCGVPGALTQPNDCADSICTPNTPPDNDSSNEGVCLAGPVEKYCVIETYRGCLTDADCTAPGDTCNPSGKIRECFTDNGVIGGTVSVSGVASPVTPTWGALFCADPTSSAAANILIGGVPGLARTTIPGTVMYNYTRVIVPAFIDASGATDVTKALNDWLAGVPDGSTVVFPASGRFRIEDTIVLKGRRSLGIEGSGSVFFATTPGYRERAHWRVLLSDGITIRDVIVQGANENAGAQGPYDSTLEAQHGFDILGSNHVLLEQVKATKVWGDFVYFGLGPGRVPTSNATVRDSYFSGSGRQGLAFAGVDSILAERNTITDVRRTTFDIEPTADFWHTTNITIRDNDIGPGRFGFASLGGAAAEVHHITIADNRLHDRRMQIGIYTPTSGPRRHDIRITGNVSDKTTNEPMIRAYRTDRLLVIGNVQPMDLQYWISSVNPYTAAVYLNESCGYSIDANDWGDGIGEFQNTTPGYSCGPME